MRLVNAASKDGSNLKGAARWKEEVWQKIRPVPKDPSC